MSLLLIGQVRGVKSQKRGDYTFHQLVVEGTDLSSHEVELNKDVETPEALAAFNKLVGKLVQVPVYIRRFTSKAGANFSLNYMGNNLPAEYKGA